MKNPNKYLVIFRKDSWYCPTEIVMLSKSELENKLKNEFKDMANLGKLPSRFSESGEDNKEMIFPPNSIFIMAGVVIS